MEKDVNWTGALASEQKSEDLKKTSTKKVKKTEVKE